MVYADLHTDRQIYRIWSASPSRGGACVRLPIDTSRLKFLVVAPAEPLRQYEEGKPREAWAPRTDVNGEVLWRGRPVAPRGGGGGGSRPPGPGGARRAPRGGGGAGGAAAPDGGGG